MVMPSFAASASSGRTNSVAERSRRLRDEPRAGAFGDEHADSSLLVEDSVVDEQVHALAGGGRVDAVERRELVRRGNLGLFGQAPSMMSFSICSAICTKIGRDSSMETLLPRVATSWVS